MSADGDRDWAGYYRKTVERPPRDTVLFALDRFDAEPPREPGSGPRFAVDLGCGGGRDSIEMLRRGWRVLGIDQEPAAIEMLTTRPDLPPGAEVEGRVESFVEARWPPCDLLVSSFALPICPPETFAALWQRMVDSLKPGGRIACQLYGVRDSWAGRKTMTFVTREQVDALLRGLEVEMLDEEEDDSTTVRGEDKHWHIFHIVARKPLSRRERGGGEGT